MKKIILVWIILISWITSAQLTCKEMLNDGDTALEKKDFYRSIRYYQAAAKKCGPNYSEVIDDKILEVFKDIQELRKISEIERKKVEDKNHKMLKLIGDITDLLQRDENTAIIGFAPLKNDIIKITMPYYNEVNKSKSSYQEISSHLQQAQTLEKLNKNDFDIEYKKAYEGSVKYLKQYKNKNIPDELMIIYLKSSVYYGWNLMNKNQLNKVKEIFFETETYAKNINIDNATSKMLYSLSIFDDALSRYYKINKKEDEAYECNHNAIKKIRKALKLDATNLFYKSELAKYLYNLGTFPKDLVSDSDKLLISKGEELALQLRKSRNSSTLGLFTYAKYVYDKTYLLNNHKEILELLNRALAELNVFIKLDATNFKLYLHRARLSARLLDFYNIDEDIKNLRFNIFSQVKSDWAAAVKNKSSINTDIEIVKDIYLKHLRYPDNFITTNPKIDYFLELESGIRNLANNFGQVNDIALMAGDIYGNLGKIIIELDKKAMNNEALSYLNKSENYFKQTDILKNTDTFSEKFSWYANVLSNRIKLNHRYGKTDLIHKDLEILYRLFMPILNKYPYDFYLRKCIKESYMRVGDLWFKEKEYIKAKPFLEYASKWGMKESSKQLSRIYREGLIGTINNKLANSLDKLAEKQVEAKLTVYADFGSQGRMPFEITISEMPKDFPYNGIDDQVIWLEQVRGGIIPPNIVYLFQKLQNFARQDDYSFASLSIFTLKLAGFNQNQFEKITEKPDLEYNVPEKILAKINLFKYQEEKEKNKKIGYEKFLNSNSKPHLLTNLEYFLEKKNEKAALDFQSKLLSIEKSSELKFSIFKLQQKYNFFLFKELYLVSNRNEVNKNIKYFLKEIESETSNKVLETYYKYLIKLEEHLSIIDSRLDLRNIIGTHYNTIAKYQILNKKFALSKASIDKGLKNKRDNLFFKRNLAPALLFQGKYNNALYLYRKNKNKSYPFDKRYKTFADAFLADFEEFKKNNIIPREQLGNTENIIALLSN